MGSLSLADMVEFSEEQHLSQSISYMAFNGLILFKMTVELLLCNPCPGQVLEQLTTLAAQRDRAAGIEWVRLERELERSTILIPVCVHDLIRRLRSPSIRRLNTPTETSIDLVSRPNAREMTQHCGSEK
ncbi:uncharacterized protein PgNI_07814 [Pyricularia grisea]|uniref:Uncharacterized protein n=1 Tax=Pyricularia grisea TaxID=148305 RepID=A0A6P8B205_PYRGI|nr:uncharacterized protein PgNI_07814 [Pyricularia grisea]TLD08892.1 hypothetical protein PgNI_07814 [Pyricularia grisea]